MAKTLGHLITWTTYGSWLQGDKRGYVKDGVIREGNPKLQCANKEHQLQDAVFLSKAQREIVRKGITEETKALGHHVHALSVGRDHVHVVLEYNPEPVSRIVALYKKAGRMALKRAGHNGRIWTRGYDKRFCFDRDSLHRRITYVQNHESGSDPA